MKTPDERLDDIDNTLRRICYELDALAGAIRRLLVATQCHSEAEQFMARFEAAQHNERPTMPPDTTESG